MPVVTTIIDDKSPLIQYDNTWLDGSAWDDNYASNYYLGTFTTNNVTDGSVTFNFNGSYICIYGAKRGNHGSYSVQVDSASYSGYNGAGNNLFQQSLFNVSLNQQSHTFTLTNTATGNLYVDIDMIAWQSEVGNANDQLLTEIIQDTDSRFQYQEPAWTTTSSTNINFNLFNNASGHVTSTYDASVTFSFTGMLILQRIVTNLTDLSADAVSIFGTSGPSNGPYSVQLDGGQSVTYNATNAYPTNYGVMIYHADNLGSGSHQVVLTNLPASSGQSLAVDYAQLWTTNTTSATISSNSTTPTPGPSTNSISTSQNDLSSGAIAGIAIAAVAAVLSAGVAFFFYRRWKAALATHHDIHGFYTPQQPPPDSTMATTTGFSPLLGARRNASLLQNDNSSSPPSGTTQQSGSNTSAVTFGSRDSRIMADTSSPPTQSPVDEGLGRRPLPEAPGGGMSLAAEFPKFSGLRPGRGQSVVTTDASSIAPSDAPPPNYNQATGGALD